MPDVPTFIEQGIPQYTYFTWFVLVAPKGTPREIVGKLATAVRDSIASPALKERFRDDSVEAPDLSPDDVNQFLVREVAEITKLAAELQLPKQ